MEGDTMAQDNIFGEFSSNKKNGLFMAGLGSMVFGAMMGAFYPAIPIAEFGFYALGAMSISGDFINKNDKWKKIFEGLGLYVGDIEDPKLPQVKKKTTKEYGYDLLVTLPLGLTSKDFEEKKLAIEQHLNAKINIEYQNKHILMKVKIN